MRLYALVLLQCVAIVWLHCVALRRNLETLRSYLAHTDAPRGGDDGVWVDGQPHMYSFHLCQQCVERATM